MRIATSLTTAEAKRLSRHFRAGSAESAPVNDEKSRSSLAIQDTDGHRVTRKLYHLRDAQLEALPAPLRHKLLACGHVYVKGGDALYASVHTTSDSMSGAFAPDSPLFGKAAGLGRYLEPEPDLEALGHSDMHRQMCFYRVMPEMLARPETRDAIKAFDSDLALFIDLGAIEAAMQPAQAASCRR